MPRIVVRSPTTGLGWCTWYRSIFCTPSRWALATARCCTTAAVGQHREHLGRDDHVVGPAGGAQRGAEDALAAAEPVDLGGVEDGHPELAGPGHDPGGLAVVVGGAVAPLAGAELPGAQADHGVPLRGVELDVAHGSSLTPPATLRGTAGGGPAEPFDLVGGGQDAGRVQLHRVPGRVPAGRQQGLGLRVEVVDGGHQLGPGGGQLRAGGVRRGRLLPRPGQEQLDAGRQHRAPVQRVGDAADRADRDGRVGCRPPRPTRPPPRRGRAAGAAAGAGSAAGGAPQPASSPTSSGRGQGRRRRASSPRHGTTLAAIRARSASTSMSVSGNFGSSSSRVSASRLAMAQLRYHLRSDGITYQGATSVSHSRSASV